MKTLSVIPIFAGLILAVTLPVWAIIVLVIFCPLCARESRRLRTGSQLTDWYWEHDMVAIRRSVFTFRPGSRVNFYRPRKFHGPR